MPALGHGDALHRLHATSALIILLLTVLHIAGVYKHAAFNQDGTFGKMLIPAKKAEEAPAATHRPARPAPAPGPATAARDEP